MKHIPDYLRVSVTSNCNLTCVYCRGLGNADIRGSRPAFSTSELIDTIGLFIDLGITKIRFTGGEPLLNPDLPKMIEAAAKHGQVKDIAVTTNGMLLSSQAQRLKDAGLNRVNASCDSFDQHTFSEMTGGGRLDRLLKGIDAAIAVGLAPLKINSVIIKGKNDHELALFIRYVVENPVSLRFIEFMPAEGIPWGQNAVVDSQTLKDRISGLGYQLQKRIDKKGDTAQCYDIPGAMGTVGFISPVSDCFCSDCNRIRLDSTGIVRECLFTGRTLDLAGLRRDGRLPFDLFRNSIETFIIDKKPYHTLDKFKRNITMSGIGG